MSGCQVKRVLTIKWVVNGSSLAAAVGIFLALCLCQPVYASVTVTDNGFHTPAGSITVANDDLLQTAVFGQSPVAGTPGSFGSNINALIDGSNTSNPSGVTDSYIPPLNGAEVIYYLNNNYPIQKINVLVSGNQSRCGQNWIIYTSVNNGADWMLLASITSSDRGKGLVTGYYDHQVIVQDSNEGCIATGVNAIKFKFFNDSIDGYADIYREIDVVAMPPATNPSPSDGSNNVLSSNALSWVPATYTVSQNVYLGTSFESVNQATDPNILPGRGNQVGSTYNPQGLTVGQTYYWRIDAIDNQGRIWKGKVWSFWVFDSSQFPNWCKNGYGVWTETSMKQVFPATRPGSYPSDPNVAISLASNEYESFQLAVLPAPNWPLRNVTVSASDLVSTDGKNHVISSSNIEWQQVGYIWISNYYLAAKAPYLNNGAANGWWPDMLLPVSSFDVNDPNRAQPIWVTVYAPSETPSGDYQGTLTITTDDGLATVVNLYVKVFCFTLAKGPGHFKTDFNLHETYFNWDTNDPNGEFRKYADFMLKHRLNCDYIYRWPWQNPPTITPRISNLEHYYEQGQNICTITHIKYWDVNSIPYSAIDSFLSNVAVSKYPAQLRNLLTFYGWDEAGDLQNFNWMRAEFMELESRYPDIPRLSTCKIYNEPGWKSDPVGLLAYYYVDWICPFMCNYDFNVGETLRAAGYQEWAYLCVWPDTSPSVVAYANFFTHYPAIESRMVWWQAYQQKFDGFLYHAVNGWPTNITKLDVSKGPFFNNEFRFETVWMGGEFPWGDGVLIYPGTSGPIGSIRLANIRDGLEDYEYLWMIAQKTGSVEVARQLCAPVTWGLSDDPDNPGFTHNPAVVQSQRNIIAQKLESFYKAHLPIPVNAAVGIDGSSVVLTWVAGESASSHDIYFGTDANAVASAKRLVGDIDGNGWVDIEDLRLLAEQWLGSTSGFCADFDDNQFVNFLDFASIADNWRGSNCAEFRGNQPGTSFNPGVLDTGKTYYWRVDEVNGCTILKGDIWSFSTGSRPDIYVLCGSNQTVKKYDWITGNFKGTFIQGSASDLSSPFSMAFNPQTGNLFVTGGNTGKVIEYNGQTGAKVKTVISGLGVSCGLAFGPNNVLYVTRSNQTSNSIAVVPLAGGTTTYISQAKRPQGIVFDNSGNFYVASLGTTVGEGATNHDDAIWKFSYVAGAWTGSVFASHAVSGGTDVLYEPTGLLIGPNGNLFVAVDGGFHCILEFNINTGAFVREAVPYAGGTPPQGEDWMWNPRGMLFDANGNLYVAHQPNGVVYEYNGITGARIKPFISGLGNPITGLTFK